MNQQPLNTPLTQIQLLKLCDTAITAAKAAGDYISHFDRSQLKIEHKDSGSSLASQVVTEVDRCCDQLIRSILEASCKHYGLALLSEESSDTHLQQETNRFTQDYFWCIDPLDGSLPFIQNKPGYAVSIALVSRAGEALIGVVYDPSKQELIHAIKGLGTYINKQAFSIGSVIEKSLKTLSVFADLSFKSEASYHKTRSALNQLAIELNLEGINEIYGNGAVKNACALLSSRPACYIKQIKTSEGGGSLWDFAASSCIIKEAGGWVSDINGQPLELNRSDSTYMGHKGVLYASSEPLARAMLAKLELHTA
ncbi:inositol monophosphatase [Agaribacterium sp. ZY112]|uniref:inositol monophosphatase family protein n=1 Tax=Agaribacterium sp. ZY112 TaxID=3233574 RepID=UPI003524DA3C